MVIVLSALVSASTALADVIPEDYEPPTCAPLACPAGSVAGGGSHGSCPSVCVPWNQTCTADGECGGPGWVCRHTRFCLETRPTGRVVQPVVVGECAADGSCSEGTCTEASRCMPDPTYVAPADPTPPPSASPPAESSSMCSVGSGGSSPLPSTLVIAVACLLWRRRRR